MGNKRIVILWSRRGGKKTFLRYIEQYAPAAQLSKEAIEETLREMMLFKENGVPVYPIPDLSPFLTSVEYAIEREREISYLASLLGVSVAEIGETLERLQNTIAPTIEQIQNALAMLALKEEIHEPLPKPPYVQTGRLKGAYRHKEPPKEYKIFTELKPMYRPIIYKGKQKR